MLNAKPVAQFASLARLCLFERSVNRTRSSFSRTISRSVCFHGRCLTRALPNSTKSYIFLAVGNLRRHFLKTSPVGVPATSLMDDTTVSSTYPAIFTAIRQCDDIICSLEKDSVGTPQVFRFCDKLVYTVAQRSDA